MDATFLDGLDGLVRVEEARSTGHIHLDEVLARTELLPRGNVVLSHFSARYRPEDVRRIIAERLPEDLRSVVRLFGVAEAVAI